MEGRDLKARLPAIEAEAKKRGKVVDDSLYDEMANYVGHRVVRDLDSNEQLRALTRLGELAIELPGDTVGGGDFRDVVVFVCTKDFGTCDDAVTAARDLNRPALRKRMTKGMAQQIAKIVKATGLSVDTDDSGERTVESGVDTDIDGDSRGDGR